MPPTAVISDIHANIHALQAVLAHIKEQGIERVICLGDVIGYGAHPAECIDAARAFAVCLRGNHEQGVLHDASKFNREAQRATMWTRSQLKPGLLSASAKKARWRFLETLPESHQENDVLFVHGSPRNPVWEYLFEMDSADLLGGISTKLAENLSLVKKLCFVGHTHVPCVIEGTGVYRSSAALGGTFTIERGSTAIVNVGSVGQPRDNDPRAGYATWENDTITFHRVKYDAAAAAKDIIGTAGLPPILGERLLTGI
ncbi:MAG TPA: metallophosphoesterase family protein [Planctomycetota bacterium]|nr:metallophosphoesterase family protein [Planctomycetota bacterium]